MIEERNDFRPERRPQKHLAVDERKKPVILLGDIQQVNRDRQGTRPVLQFDQGQRTRAVEILHTGQIHGYPPGHSRLGDGQQLGHEASHVLEGQASRKLHDRHAFLLFNPEAISCSMRRCFHLRCDPLLHGRCSRSPSTVQVDFQKFLFGDANPVFQLPGIECKHQETLTVFPLRARGMPTTSRVVPSCRYSFAVMILLSFRACMTTSYRE